MYTQNCYCTEKYLQFVIVFFLAVKANNLMKLPQSDSQIALKDDYLTLKHYVHWKLSLGSNCTNKGPA